MTSYQKRSWREQLGVKIAINYLFPEDQAIVQTLNEVILRLCLNVP